MNTCCRKRFRSVLAGFCFAVFGICSFGFGLALLPPFFLLPEIPRRRIAVALNRALWKIFSALMIALRLISVRQENPEILESARGAVVVANHPSLIDVVLLLAMTPRPVCVVKGALSHNVFMKCVVQVAHLGNDMPPEKFFTKAGSLLNRGFNIIIFPEGTRTDPDAKPTFHRGAAQLALIAGAKIVPVRIRVSPRILGKRQKWFDVSERCVRYELRAFPPLAPEDFGGNAEPRHSRAKRITETLRELLASNANCADNPTVSS